MYSVFGRSTIPYKIACQTENSREIVIEKIRSMTEKLNSGVAKKDYSQLPTYLICFNLIFGGLATMFF